MTQTKEDLFQALKRQYQEFKNVSTEFGHVLEEQKDYLSDVISNFTSYWSSFFEGPTEEDTKYVDQEMGQTLFLGSDKIHDTIEKFTTFCKY